MALIHILDKQQDKIIGTLNTAKGQVDEPLMTRGIENFYTFDMRAFAHFDKLTKRNRLLVQDADGFFNEFIIIDTNQYKRHEKIVKSNGSFADLRTAKVIEPRVLEGVTPLVAITTALEGTEWFVGEIAYTGNIRTIKIEDHTDPYSFLKKIASTFNLEIRYRVKVEGNRIIGRYVDMVEEIAGFEGKEITFGKDLIDVRRVEDSMNIVTALVGLGPIKEDGTRLEVFVESQEALERWGRNGRHLVRIYEPQTEDEDMTLARLTTLTENELEKRIDAVVTYECQAVSIEKVFGRSHEKIRLGQTVRIKDDGYTPPLYLEARIRETTENVASRQVVNFKIGNYIEFKKEDLEKQIAALTKRMSERLSKLIIASISSSAGDVFKNGQGSTTLTANALLGGVEFDTDGTKYNYTWSKHDKNGNPVSFNKTGKHLTVNATEIDESATYFVEVSNEHVNVPAQITLTTVFDGTDGEDGSPGKDGKDGYTPIKGVDYFDGVPGQDGKDGSSSYLWVRYSQNANGNPMTDNPTNAKYVGVATTETPNAPTEYTSYKWSLIKGEDGIPGESGADGKTSYLHVKYSDDGKTFTANNGETVGAYIGTYVDFTEADSNDFSKYTWNKVKGDKGDTGDRGPQGIQGPAGSNGQSQYVHIRYSANTNGNPMTVNPQSNSKYIGLANTTSPTAPTSYTAYTWALIRGNDGQDGIPGEPGKDGQTTYTWVKYADDENGRGIHDNPDGKRYIGLAFNKTTPTESNNPADYSWSPLYEAIVPINGGKQFNNPLGASINIRTSSIRGALVISTPITFPYMTTMRVAGYNYLSNNTTIDLTISFYAYSTTILQHSYVNRGDYPVNKVRVGRDSTGKAVVIIGDTDTLWNYPTVQVDDVKITYTNPPNSFKQGWSMEFSSNLDAYTSIIELGGTDFKQEIKSAQTTADGKNTVFRQNTEPSTLNRKIGDLWFKTNEGNKMHVWTGSWTETKLDYQALSVGKLSAISADMGTITAGEMRWDVGKGGTLTLGGTNDGFGRLVVLNDEDDAIADLDSEVGGFSELYVGDFHSPTVVRYNLDSYNFYVDPIGGDDTNSGSSWTDAKQTIQSCIDNIPKFNDGDIEIFLHYENCRNMFEHLLIAGFVGDGVITINGQTRVNTVNGSIEVKSCLNRINFTDLSIGMTGTHAGAAGLRSTSSNYVTINNSNIIGTIGSGLLAETGGRIVATNCQINDATYGMSARYGGFIYQTNCGGKNIVRGMYADEGSVIAGHGSAPEGATSNTFAQRGAEIRGTFTYPTPPTPPPAPTPTTTLTVNSSSGGTYRVSNGYWDTQNYANTVTQGYYGYGVGVLRGAWFFGTQLSPVVGKTIKSMRVWVQRESTGGSGGKVTVRIKSHSYSTRPAGLPAMRSDQVDVALGRGEGRWVTLPVSFRNSFASGAAKGIGIEAPSNTSAYYARLVNVAKIEVTYQ